MSDILTNLSKIEPESHFAHSSCHIGAKARATLAKIGKTLGVATLLEEAFAASQSGARQFAANRFQQRRALW